VDNLPLSGGFQILFEIFFPVLSTPPPVSFFLQTKDAEKKEKNPPYIVVFQENIIIFVSTKKQPQGLVVTTYLRL